MDGIHLRLLIRKSFLCIALVWYVCQCLQAKGAEEIYTEKGSERKEEKRGQERKEKWEEGDRKRERMKEVEGKEKWESGEERVRGRYGRGEIHEER